MGKLKTVWRVTRQTLLVLLITLILAEIAFRFYNYVHPSFIFYDTTYNRFRGKPNAPDYDFHLNSKGFKDVEFKQQKEEGTYRILGLGDSFAFGVVPYKNSFLTLLEEDLNRGGQKTEIINMGISGIGPRDYLALLVNEGLVLKPDKVLVCFFIGNDFLVEKEERKLYTYSYVASFISYLLTVRGEQVLFPNNNYDDNAPTFSDARFVTIESERSEIYRKGNKQFESDFTEAMNSLIQIKQRCDELGIALTVVLIPDEAQVNRTVQSRVLEVKAFNSSADDFDFTLPNRLLAARFKEQSIDFIDLMDGFSRAIAKTALYKPRDTHWNIAGNMLAAELIKQHLQPSSKADSGAQFAIPAPSNYEGFQDETDCRSIKGWVWDRLHPNSPVKADVYDGDRIIATVQADLFRQDLLDAGKGNGSHAFEYQVPGELKDGKPHSISVRISGTITGLTGTPKQIRCD